MPATDWREITYSRTHLRPGDGLDPDVRAMRRQVRELGRKQTISAYEKARDLLVAADKRERAMKETLRKDELVRQENERKSLAEALKMQKDTFDEYWAHKRREMEEKVKHA